MRLLIFADADAAVPNRLLEAALELANERDDVEVGGLVTSRPQPPVSRQGDRATGLLDIARRHRLPVLTPASGDPNDAAFRRRLIDRVRADVAVSVYCLRIFGRELLDTFAHAINLHNGLLPRYKGLRASAFAIYNGERRVGYTFHRMTESVDGGPILAQGSVAVAANDDLWAIERRLASAAARSLPKVLEMAAAGDPGRPQTGAGSYHSLCDGDAKTRIQRPDLLSADELRLRLRAFGRLELTIGGECRTVMSLGPPAGDRARTFRTADGVLLAADPATAATSA